MCVSCVQFKPAPALQKMGMFVLLVWCVWLYLRTVFWAPICHWISLQGSSVQECQHLILRYINCWRPRSVTPSVITPPLSFWKPTLQWVIAVTYIDLLNLNLRGLIQSFLEMQGYTWKLRVAVSFPTCREVLDGAESPLLFWNDCASVQKLSLPGQPSPRCGIKGCIWQAFSLRKISTGIFRWYEMWFGYSGWAETTE